MAKSDACPECGRSSSKFRDAVKARFTEFVAERVAEQKALDDEDAKVRLSKSKAREKLEAAAVARAAKWDGHTHRYPNDPTDGVFVCRDCEHAEPASSLPEFKLQADEPGGGIMPVGGVVIPTDQFAEPPETATTAPPEKGS